MTGSIKQLYKIKLINTISYLLDLLASKILYIVTRNGNRNKGSENIAAKAVLDSIPPQ